MKRMKCIIGILFLLLLCLPVCSAIAGAAVVDDAGLFTQSQIAQMETIISRIQDTYQVDAVVLTCKLSSRSDSSLQDYADRYFEDNGYGIGEDRAGMLFMIDMGNRYTHISTAGVMIDYLSDKRIEKLLDAATDDLSDRQYGKGTLALLNKLERFMAEGIEEGNFRYDSVTGQRLTGLYNKLTTNEALFSILIGAGAAALMIFGVISAYSLRKSTYHFNKMTQSGVVITDNQERFVRRTVSRIKNSPPGSGNGGGGGHGGSGVHISSGGMSHGGGGRHF